MDDRRAGLALRALRRRRGWRQRDLAVAAGISQSSVSRAERGHVTMLSLHSLRRLFGALDARAELDVRWRAGELDRVLDARHAALVAAVAETFAANGWTVLDELTYSVYGEQGSIDVVGVRQPEGAAVVVEVKSEITSWEETQRRFDAKVRLAPKVLFERLGWRPSVVARVLVVEEGMTNRRRVEGVGQLARDAYPGNVRAVRRWLRKPDGALRAMWFLPVSHRGTRSERGGGFHRVRRPPTGRS